MSRPSVSVVIATYNAEATLERCIQSVLTQQPPVELIVVDGQSTDGTMAIVRRHQERITHVVSEPDRGLYDALNKGVRLASSRYICILGADDELLRPDSLDALITGGGAADVIYGNVVVRGGDGSVLESPALPLKHFPLGMPFCHQATLERRELLLRTPFGESLASDYRHFYSLYLSGVSFCHVPARVACYAMGGLSDRQAVASTWDRLRINLELRGVRSFLVTPYYLAQIAICWLKPRFLRT